MLTSKYHYLLNLIYSYLSPQNLFRLVQNMVMKRYILLVPPWTSLLASHEFWKRWDSYIGAFINIKLKLPSGSICLVCPNAVIPDWLAPLLLPYCSPIILLLSANCSAVKDRLFSSATLTPNTGPLNCFFCACGTRNSILLYGEKVNYYQSSQGKEAVDHLQHKNKFNCSRQYKKNCHPLPCRYFCFRKDHSLGKDLGTWAHKWCNHSGTFQYFPSTNNQIFIN